MTQTLIERTGAESAVSTEDRDSSAPAADSLRVQGLDRKSTRLNSSHI